jgi:hypothetical protein
VLHTVDIKRYNGKLTVTNPATGLHRTFRIKTMLKGPLKGMRVLQLLIGADNQSAYKGFAFVQPSGKVNVWTKCKGEQNSPSVFQQLAMIVERSEWYAQHRGLEYQYSVRCRRCNRELTDPESIEAGIGPICREVV